MYDPDCDLCNSDLHSCPCSSDVVGHNHICEDEDEVYDFEFGEGLFF